MATLRCDGARMMAEPGPLPYGDTRQSASFGFTLFLDPTISVPGLDPISRLLACVVLSGVASWRISRRHAPAA